MSIILNIDTALQTASIGIAIDGQNVATASNPSQKDHAAWIQAAIKDLLFQKGLSLSDLNAIGVSEGPGSYTGLRVGMATAKGLCFVLNIPLLTASTLKMMAFAAKDEQADLLCPMIDARRMEVFTAMYNSDLQTITHPTNIILHESSFKEELMSHKILFFGTGSNKFRDLIQSQNAIFREIEATAADLAVLTFEKLKNGEYADLAYAEPFYGKEFHSTVKHYS